MIVLLETWLPHVGASIVLACILLAVTERITANAQIQRAVFAATLIISLLPLMEFSLSHYVRVLTGDLSILGLIWLSFIAYRSMFRGEKEPSSDTLMTSVLVLASALVLYPTAMGLTYFDLYAYGYYPIILGPAVLAIFCYALWFGHVFPAALLGFAFISFAFGILESNNLWDYLLDPVIVAYCLYQAIKHRQKIVWTRPSQRQVETFLGLVIAAFLCFAIFLARFNHDAFQFEFVIEDGFIEWCTVVVLFSTMLVCGRRFLRLRNQRSMLFLGVTGLLTLLCLFGAGEEISWGQRIFGLETPEYLKGKNAQGELGVHNLVIEINGKDVKLNKLIFGTGLAIALSIYLFIATPLYRTKPAVRSFFNAIAAPMPRNYHIVGYLLIVAVVELLIDSSKRGEMTEFAGSMMFALNVIYPYNPEIFDPEQPLPSNA
jgi:hypothetical protein